MTGDRLRRAQDVFERVVDAPPDHRAAILAECCGDDGELMHFVDELLSAHETGMAGFLTRPAVTELTPGLSPAAPAAMPAKIGQYRILRELGEGGMGVVYLAQQEHPLRLVALKLIRPGVFSASLRRRFQYEAEVLGQLQHPGIAHVFEAGVETVAGPGGAKIELPYFAMEYIEGRSLTDFVEASRLPTRERLRLAAEICDALQHGHQKGVIHRDLKPANILVDSAGRPKLIDFGVARCVSGELASRTLHTEVGQLIGTIQYMSPEQVHGDSSRVDTRSDVFSLGVILFELLTGRLPYDLANLPLDYATRAIRETPPARPGSLDRSLRGDVETIILKSLAKDPDRRYQSAGELRIDILNYLAGSPIAARPASLSYQLRLLAGRNRAAVLGLLGLLVSLLAGLIGSSIMYFRSESARESEARQRRITEAVNEFLNQDLLAAISPRNTANRELKMRDVLDTAARRLEGRFTDAPLVEAAIRNTLGTTYRSLGEREAAEPHLARALEIHARELGEDHAETINSRIELGALAYYLSQPARADELLSRGYEQAVRQFGQADHRTLNAKNSLGFLRITQGRLDEADLLLNAARDAQLAAGLADAPEAWLTLANIGILRIAQRRFADAESVLIDAIAGQRGALDAGHPDLLLSINNLASLLNELGRFGEAEPLLLELLAKQRERLGEEHPDTLNTMNNLGFCLKGQRRASEAMPYYTEALELRRRVLGDDHEHTLISLNNMGGLLQELGRFDEAERTLREALAARRRVSGDQHRLTHDAMVMLAALYFRMGRLDAAESMLGEVIPLLQVATPPDDAEIARLLFFRGVSLSELGRLSDAERAWRDCYQVADRSANESRAREAAKRLAALFEARRDDAESALWRSRAAATQPAAP